MDSLLMAGCLRKDFFQVIFRICDRIQVKGIDKGVEDRVTEKGRDTGADIDVFDAKGEQCEGDTDDLLFIPRENQGKRQVVDTAVKGRGQGQCHLNRATQSDMLKACPTVLGEDRELI